MTEDTSPQASGLDAQQAASSSEQASSAQSSPSVVLSDILLRLQELEESVHPRLQALESAVLSLAQRAEDSLPSEIANELDHVRMALASLGSSVLGHRQVRDGGKGFLSWLERMVGGAPAPSVPQEAAPVVHPLSPSPK